MSTALKRGTRVYVHLCDNVFPGIILADIHKSVDVPTGRLFAVRLAIDGEVFVKAFAWVNLSLRRTIVADDALLDGSVKPRRRGSKYEYAGYFQKAYSPPWATKVTKQKRHRNQRRASLQKA